MSRISQKYVKNTSKISKIIYIYGFSGHRPRRAHWRARDATSTRGNAAGKTLSQKNACEESDAKGRLQGLAAARKPERAVFGDPQNMYMYRVGAKDDKKKGVSI